MTEFSAMRWTEALTFSSIRARNPAEGHSLIMNKVLWKFGAGLTIVDINITGVVVPKLDDLRSVVCPQE